ncbi:ectopic P granules protein 5 homolog [Euwallacea similis]|uniref:ectopic P granules protein 5 homolog n=1 Tax=Euwallacea similis TaxID=1736056 RepID=UPI00344C050B
METTVEKPQKKHKKRAAKANEAREPVDHSTESEDVEVYNIDTSKEQSSSSKVKSDLPQYNPSADSHSSAKTNQSEESQKQHCTSQIASIAEEMKEQTNLSVCAPDDLAQTISNPNIKGNILINTKETPTSLPRSIPIKVHEHNEFEKYLELNKQLLDTLESIPTKPAHVAKGQTVKSMAENNDKLSDCSEIRPYTEDQLNALYFNTEFSILEEFTNTFIHTELKSQQLKKAYLYELLVNYLSVREKITGNNIELAQLRDEYRNLQTMLWTTDVACVMGRATCQDGKVVQASQEYHRSVFDRSGFQSLVMVLSKMQKLIYEKHVLYSFRAEDLRLQIRSYIVQLIENILNATKLNVKSPVSLLTGHELSHIQMYLNELRLSVSILFAFQRKLIKEPIFLKDTRDWLSQLVAVLIRLANFQDHLFLLHHILRCPARVSSWASQFVQVPLCLPVTQPFANYEINHLLTTLCVILSPVKGRSEFLKDIAHTQNVSSETSWVVIDSDGEEDEEPSTSLRENDLVAIINQLPLRDMFRAILYVERSDGKDYLDANVITEQHILRYFAFSSVLLRLLRQGLETYCLPKYNQLSKRLSRLIRHVVQYATDQWEIFIMNGNVQDRAMVQRLQTEYDAFFLRAIYYLYTSQKQWAWQFLAVVPYNMVTLSTLWKIHYFLHMPDNKAEDIVNFTLNQNFKELVSERELIEQFEEKLLDLGDAEIYYLLNTFANMALARDESDLDFIYFCTLDILQIGFISQTTQETCSKSARILLAHLTSKYPYLLSTILKTVYDNMDKIGHRALYLYEEIPLTIWKVLDEDFHLIGRLLMNHSVNSDQSKLSRMILSRLNWDNILYEKHCETAVLVLNAVDQEPSYLQWGWQTILRLKLHISDRHFQELGRIQEPERCEILMKGIRENHPLSSFVAVLMTTWGHLVPLICSHGLNQLCAIQSHQKHEVVLFALYQIVPVFISCQECLINSSKFQEILMNLINADRGYISYAKSFIVTQNTVLQQFGNMIETQIVNYSFYDFHSPRLLVRLWMNSLISIPNWNNDKAILYLLDVIIRTAFPYPDALQVVHENFRDICLNSTPQESSSIISKLKWSSASTKSSYGLLSGSLAQYPWLAYVFFEIEHQEKEVKTGLWTEVLKSLSEQKGKISVDNAIKNVASNLKLPIFTSSYLCIYRYAQQAMDTDMEHPLLPLFWQRFFILYLFRLPQLSSTGQICVGEKFFEGIVNFSFLKKLKRRLQESIDHYRSEVETSGEADNEARHIEHEKLLYSVFRAFLLWLEEPRLQSGNLLLQSLPSQYEPQLLSLIIHENNQTPWYNYVNRDQIMRDQAISIRHWRVANFREKSNINQPLPNPGNRVESSDPVERILRRLASYDAIQTPPVIEQLRVEIPQANLSGKDEMFKSLKPSFDTLIEFAHAHNQNVSNNKGLDSTYKELIPQLFTSVMKRVKKHIPCKGKNQTVLCCGPAIITLEFQEAKRNERIDHAIQVNRQSYESLVERSLQTPAESLYTASVSIQQCVRILQDRLRTNPETTELGIELFYHILSYFQDEVLMYLPAKTLFTSCIEKLGQSHICGVENEMPRLLELILKEPKLGAYLAPYFLPRDCGNSNMLFMYTTIIKNVPSKYDVLFALISKFDIENWLSIKNPNLNQRSKLIENIVHALSELGFDPPVEALALHSLYKKHLVIVFEHQFPEHYGEILTKLLKTSIESSENNQISSTVWIDIITSLAKPLKVNLKAPLRDQLREYAQHQKMLSHDELLGTCNMLAQFFTQDRLVYGLYGLYPKCRNYINIFALLLEMAGHGLIVSMLNTHQGLLGDKLCEKIWPYIRDMYAPWLIPYSTNNLKDDMANWIQQLTDDRSILLPWIPTDSELADIMLTSFCQCVTFLLDTLPASFNILSYFFQWYVTSFGHPAVKTHVLSRVHKAFAVFPWTKFWPSLMDVDFMLKVVDQYLPECHSFLGHIFVEIPWAMWISTFNDAPQQIKNRVYYCFLNILVKLSIEPKGRKNNLEKDRSIIIQAENFDWGNLEPLGFQHIMDWVVMSCDSSVIFKHDILDLDYRLLCLLKLVSGYNKVLPQESQDLIAKRHTFVKAHKKLLSVYVSRNRNMINSSGISALINGQLDDLDLVVTTNSEFEMLVWEILSVINIPDISECSLKVTLKWIESKTYGLAVKSLLKILGPTINNSKHLGKLCEAALVSYFNTNILENNMEEPTWQEASELLHVCVSKPNDFEQALIEEAAILTLNAILLQKIRRNINTENLFNICLSWHEKIKLREPLESKFPLLWLTILSLSIQYCEKDESIMAVQLHKFSQILLQLSEDSGSNRWTRGFLNVIGFSKSEEVTLNFRFICRAMAGYVLAQLPDMKALPRKVRTSANAPSPIGTPGGNPECARILLELDFGQSTGKIKDCAQYALTKIQDPHNSLHNAREFLMTLLKQFYSSPYIKSVDR